MATFGQFITSVTQERFVPKVVDNVLNGNILCNRFLNKPKNWMGGYQLVVPVNLTADTRGGSYSGFDALDTTQANIRVRGTVDPRQNYWPVVLSNLQRAVNDGDMAVIDLVATEMEQAAEYMKDGLGDQFYGDGTGNTGKNFIGLAAAVDDSTSVTTFQGISRSTYANWRATRTTQSGSIALSHLATDFDAAQHGTDKPTLMVTTPAVFSLIEALFTQYARYNQGPDRVNVNGETVSPEDGLGADGGFTAIRFRGVPLVADEKCTSGYLYTLNEKHLWFAKMKHPEYATSKSGFAWSGWKVPVDQDAVIGHFFLYGNLVSDSCRTQAVRTTITS